LVLLSIIDAARAAVVPEWSRDNLNGIRDGAC